LVCPRNHRILFLNYTYVIQRVQASVADPDPYNFFLVTDPLLSVLDPDLDPSLLRTTKLTATENVKMYACCLDSGGPTNKENQAKIKKMYHLRCITF
jgi:hypothetical protein